MEAKKSPKANLEKKKFILTEIGLILSLAIVLLAFEWRTYEDSISSLRNRMIDLTPEEVVQITQQINTPPPPKPIPNTTFFNIVDNDEDIDMDIDIDTEADDDTEMPPYEPDIDNDDDNDNVPDDIPFISVQEMPGFSGGDNARIQYLRENLKYPLLARETGISGNVYFTFVVEKDGSISNIELLKGIGGGCDEEAYRVISNMPKWNPGKQRGHPVRVKLTMHIEFTLL